MQMTVSEIFEQIHPTGSSSMARRHIVGTIRSKGDTCFDGHLVTGMTQVLKVEQDSVFQVGKNTWTRDGNKWIREKMSDRTGVDTNEGWIRIGRQLLVFPLTQKNPDGCDYVRVVKDEPGFPEVERWAHTEWEKSGAEVMGALIGCLCGGIPDYDPRVMPKPKASGHS